MSGVSVVICCYNSRTRLPATLRALAKQTPVDAPYELIIVDNNCTDDTVEVANDSWRALDTPFPMRVVAQHKPGLGFARIKGVQEASHEYVVFCDDDNWLCEDYLLKTRNHFESSNDIALLGGVGIPEFETSPPPWFETVKGFGYAVGDEGRDTGYVRSLYGAGMALRRSVFLEVIDESRMSLTDREGSRLSSGGDTEICEMISSAGYRIYLDRTMTFKHFLPKERLTWSYYLELRRSFGVAIANLQLRRGANERGRTARMLSLLKYSVRNWKLSLFASRIQTEESASFVQQQATFAALAKAAHN